MMSSFVSFVSFILEEETAKKTYADATRKLRSSQKNDETKFKREVFSYWII